MNFWPFRSTAPKPVTEEEEFRRYGQPFVIPLASGPQGASRADELEHLSQWVGEASPTELARLDRSVRYYLRNYPYLPLWLVIQPDELEGMLDAPVVDAGLLGIASFHANGFVREKAVTRLTDVRTGLELPFLLLRLNDWVKPIHEAAAAALQARLTPEYAAAFVRCLPLLFDQEDPRRRDHGPWLQAVSTMLKRPECEPALWDGLQTGERAVRRLCFRLLAESDHVPLEKVVQEALADPDPGLRRTAAVRGWNSLSVDALQALLPRLRRDPSPSVRREGLQGAVERLPEQAEAELRDALLDGHASLREMAQFYLKRRHDVDAAAFYRTVLATGEARTILAALGGLGETGTPADAALVLPSLAHPLTRLRKAAVRALGRLDGDAQVGPLLTALEDPSPSVTREARAALQPRLTFVDPEALWQAFVSQKPLHVRLALLSLLAQMDRWESISYMVRASADEDEFVRDKAKEQIRVWVFGRVSSFMKPTPTQIARLRDALAQSPNAELEATVLDWERKQRVDA